MKSITIAGLILLFAGTAAAQDTTWHYLDGSKAPDRLEATYYETTSKDTNDAQLTVVQTWYLDGHLRSEGRYVGYGTLNKRGTYVSLYPDGKKQVDLTFGEGSFDGLLESWWENGQQRRKDLYKGGKLISGQCWDMDGNPVDHYLYEQRPEYPGGIEALMRYLSSSIQYPKAARKQKIEGLVFISFVVDGSGEVRDVKVIKSVHPLLDDEAVRVVSAMGKWQPGSQEGRRVIAQYNLPLDFKIR